MDATISAEPKFRLSGFRNANYFLAFQTCVFMCIMVNSLVLLSTP